MTTTGSLWAATMPEGDQIRAAPLPGDTDVDVAIVGGGLTGLWTAWYLADADPSLRIVVLERDTIGFGASGRNGGWCSALMATGLRASARRYGRDAAITAQRVMHDAVDEVGRFLRSTGSDAHFTKGGTITLARSPAQVARLTEDVEVARAFGFGEDDVRWLSPHELATRCHAAGAERAVHTPHCAAVHPLRLVHAVGSAGQRAGVTIHERTTVVDVGPGVAMTDRGRVRAEVVVLATEAYTTALPRRRRDLAPVYSLMVGTATLSAAQWDEIGLTARETFNDARNLIIYGQRTADDRLAFGGRGAPYHFGSNIQPGFDTDERTRAMLVEVLGELFPVVRDVDVPYHWGGPLGIPRDWQWSIRQEPGLVAIGGYVGDGVATTNVAGRTVADLITRRDSELIRQPWVGHRSPRWEPEPLRWLGINLGRHAAARADAAERSPARSATARARAWSSVLHRLTR